MGLDGQWGKQNCCSSKTHQKSWNTGIFVIDAAVRQLVSGSSLKYEVSAVTMAADKIFFKNQIFTVIVSFNSL